MARKSDINESDWEVSREEGLALAKEYSTQLFYETSAKTNKLINGMFEDITRDIAAKKDIIQVADATQVPCGESEPL